MPSLADLSPGLADANAIVLDAIHAFLPADRVDVAAWAAANRWVEGARPGRWDSLEAPYLLDIQASFSSEIQDCTAIVGPAQCGKTAVAENWLGASIDQDPAKFLWYMQTDDSLRAYVKTTIAPFIEAHPCLKSKLGLRPVDDSLGFKRFRGMTVEFLSATRSNLINKNAARLVCDEWDAYTADFGDPKVQFDSRRQSYGSESHLTAISHPDKAQGLEPEQWNAGIMLLYRDSDRRTWWWPCPHCNGWSSPNPGTARAMRIAYPDDAPLDEIQDAAHLLCPCCGAEVPDSQRRAMNREGRWVAAGQDIDIEGEVTGVPVRSPTAGFWIVGAMSPFLLKGIGGLARNRVQAERAFHTLRDEESERSLREVVVKQWGEPYTPPRDVRSIGAEAIADRTEPHLELGRVPDGVRFITVAVDVQSNRFEILVRGWGVMGESWVIDHARRLADTAVSAADWDDMIAAATRAWPLADGSGRSMRPRAIGIDSGGAAGVTSQAYAAWLRAKRDGLARLQGRIDGREAWNILLLKGASTPNPQLILISYPDSARKDRWAAARGQVPVGIFGGNRFKDDLRAQLVSMGGGPSAVHIPAALRQRADEDRDAWFRQLTAETRKPNGRWSNPTGTRNEVTDLMVMCHVMARLHGLTRLDWDAPPAWAAPWDSNSLIVAPLAPAAADAAAAPGVPAQPAQGPVRRLVARKLAH